MSLVSRTLGSFVAFPAVLLTFASISADWFCEFYATTDQFGNHISLFELRRQGDQLVSETQSSMQRIHCKERIAEALAAGKMPLVEAASQFRSLSKDPKGRRYALPPESSHGEGEAWCRAAIDWSVNKIRLEQSPRQAEALRHRLERELDEQLTSYGAVKLPN